MVCMSIHEIEQLYGFTDNNFIPRIEANQEKVMNEMENLIESIRKWL
jgi:hypothetical protein